MTETIRKYLELAGQYPDLCAGIMGVLMSMFATQFVKKALPDSLSEETYRRIVHLTAFVTGWIFGHGAWTLFDPHSSHFEKLYASTGCGFASPAIYSFISAYMKNRYPWFDKVFSGRPAQK